MRRCDYDGLQNVVHFLTRGIRIDGLVPGPKSILEVRALRGTVTGLRAQFKSALDLIGMEKSPTAEMQALEASARGAANTLDGILATLGGLEEDFKTISQIPLSVPKDPVHEESRKREYREAEQARLSRRVVVTTTDPGRKHNQSQSFWNPL